MKNKSFKNYSVSFIDKIFSINWIPFGIIISLGLFVYFQAIFFDFSYLDDNTLILGNTNLLSSFSNIVHFFQIDVFNSTKILAFYYRPILTLSFLFDYQIGGISPFIYHFTNIWLHILATCLLFSFLKKLDYRKELAFLFSIIFLVHPVLTQAVAWIPGRNDSLLAIFILSSFIFLIKETKEKRTNNLLWSFLFFSLALFTKESAIFILPIIFYYLYFINKENKVYNKFYLLLGSSGAVGIWILLRYFALNGSTPATLINIIKSVFSSLPALIQLLGKIFFPFNLSVLPIMKDTTFIYGIISIILLTVILFFTKNRRWNYILFGLMWFLFFLLPSFIRPDPNSVANFSEHRLYLPIIGIFIILLETDFIKKIDIKKKSTLIIISSVIIIFSLITMVHSRNFVNRLAFWKNATETSPSYAFSSNNLGAMNFLDGNMLEAEIQFKKTLELNPNEPMTHNNLGLTYANQNKFTEAEIEYKKEIEINPNYDNAYFNLGLLYWKQEKIAEAEIKWKETLEINPNHIDALKALAANYYDQKNYKDAAFYTGELYKRGFQLPPEFLQLIQTY